MTLAAFSMDENVTPHITVMRDEVVHALSPLTSGVVVDATVGYGGHSEALLRALPGISLVGFDRDPEAVSAARQRLAPFGQRVEIVQREFGGLRDWLHQHGLEQIDGIVADLGVSSPQLDQQKRGLSFRYEGPLDMRMNQSHGETALELIQRLDQDELADLIYELGEERRSRRVAACIKQAEEVGELNSTLELRKAVVRAVGPRRVGGIDPATRTFQALRIGVNRELEELTSLLGQLHEVVHAGGIAALISFHSLEDRLVKRCFQERALWKKSSSKPLYPSSGEQEQNPRARSAKLRVAMRTTLMQVPKPLPEGVDPWQS